MKYKVTGPDGKPYLVTAPEGATPEQVKEETKKRVLAGRINTKPSMGQRMKKAVSGIATKAGTAVANKFPFMAQPSTIPEIVGQMIGGGAGRLLGAETGSSAPAVIGSGLGGAMGRTLGQAPQAIGEMLAAHQLRTPTTRKIKQNLMPSFSRGATFGALGEAVPIAWRGAKAIGRELESGVGSLSGVGERVAQLKKFPFWQQLAVLKPGKSSIPTPQVAGAAQGALEGKLGIPTIQEAVEDQVYQQPGKKATSIRSLEISTRHAATGGATDAEASALREALKKAGVEGDIPKASPTGGKSTPIMRSVRQALKEGTEPEVNDAVAAIRDTAERLDKAPKGSVLKSVYGKQFAAISKYIESKIPELAKARKLTNLAHIRDELLHMLPKAPSGDPYRFGVMRLLWMLRTSISMLSGGLMSPYGAGVGSVAGQALTKAIDPVLMNKFAPAGIAGAVAALQSRRKKQ